mgnify:CR=1 FL=1
MIGITGNIGTGKSTVRHMLEKKGVLGVDADGLVHCALQKGAKSYQKVLLAFGKDYLKGNGEINRIKLAETVFQDKGALKRLECILHPLVIKSFKHILRKSQLPIIAIEAIKLLESDLVTLCNNIWVVNIQEREQIRRLMQSRSTNEAQIKERLAQQSSPEEKIQQSDIVIYNDQSLKATWKKVEHFWKTLLTKDLAFKKAAKKLQKIYAPTESGISRIIPDSADQMAETISRYFCTMEPPILNVIFAVTTPKKIRQDILFQALCNFHFLKFSNKNQTDFAIWNSKNFIAQTYYLPHMKNRGNDKGLIALINQIESDAHYRLCKVSRVLAHKEDNTLKETLHSHGYKVINAKALKPYWRDATNAQIFSAYDTLVKSL